MRLLLKTSLVAVFALGLVLVAPKGALADTSTSTLAGTAQSIAVTSFTGTTSTLNTLTFTNYGIYGAGGAATTTAIRIKIPATINAVFLTSITTSTQSLVYTLNGVSAQGATSTVYVDNRTVQINPSSDFANGDVLTIAGLKVIGMVSESAATAFQFSVDGGANYHDGTFTLAVTPAALTSTGVAPDPNPVATVAVGTSPRRIAFDGRYIWVGNYSSANVSKLDINTNQVVATTTVGAFPRGIAFDGSNIWVADNSSNNVSKIDINTNQVIATTIAGTTAWGVAYGGGYIWVVNNGSNNVSKIDIDTNQVVATTTVGVGPLHAVFDDSHIWVTNYSSNNVSKIDINTNQVVATTTVGTGPRAIAFDGSHVWVTNYSSASVSKIDINTNQVVATTTVGSNPRGIAFDGTYLWVVNYGSASVSKIDIHTNQVVATVAVYAHSIPIAFDGAHLWVGSFDSNTVSKINTSLRALATSTVMVTFTQTTSTPANGKIKVTFPSGFDVSGVASSTCISGGFTGSFATALNGQSVIITRSGGSVATAGAKSCLIDNVVAPDSGTTGTFAVETQTSSGDSGTIANDIAVAAITITPGINGVTISPASNYTQALSTVTVNFTASQTIPLNGKVKVVFPSGFDAGFVLSATCGSMDGAFAVSQSGGSMVTITRSGGTAEPGGAQTCSITSIKNPNNSGTTGVFQIQTLNSVNGILDNVSNVPGISIVSGGTGDRVAPGEATNVTVTSGTNGTSAVLTWTNPTDSDLAGVRVYRSTTSGVLGQSITTTLAGTYTDTNLTTGVTYYYILRPVDTSSNELVTGREYPVTPTVSTTTGGGGGGATTPTDSTHYAPLPTPPSTYTYPSNVSAYDLVKNSTMSAVYFVAHGKRYPFPNEMVFKSWYQDFSNVKTIPDTDLASLTIGGVVQVRPGTFLVKITSDPKVYAVEPNGILRWIESESVATSLYGSTWSTRVRDLDVSFFQGYTIGSSVGTAVYPIGSVVADGTRIVYIAPTGSREFKNDSIFTNRFDPTFVLHTTATLPTASTDVTGVEPALAEPVVE